ncbi:MAG: LptF/LptG family permease [Victivallaceae bacterium]|jgi:lipopolysaccharide export system permease protein
MENRKESPKITPRRWLFLPTLDYYILREFMIHLSVLMLAFVLLFIIGDVFNDLSDFLDAKTPLGVMANYFLLKLPGNIRFILPISILLACMWTMAKFGKNMEVTAMRASGVSLFRCGGPVLVVGLIVTGINFWFNESLVPNTDREAEVLKSAMTRSRQRSTELQRMLTFRSPDKERTWLFKSFKANGEHEYVTLKSFRPDGSLAWDITAQTSRFVPKNGWVFERVSYTPYSLDGLMPKSSQRFDRIEKSLKEVPETPEDIINAVKDVEELPMWVIVDILHKTKNMAARCEAIFLTVLYYRIAFPWSCFLAVFLGLPLATKNERSGIMLAVISATALIIVYMVASQICLVLGKQGIINPMIAGLGPTAGFIIFGWYNVIKSRA